LKRARRIYFIIRKKKIHRKCIKHLGGICNSREPACVHVWQDGEREAQSAFSQGGRPVLNKDHTVYSASFFVQRSLRVMGLKIIYLGTVHMAWILNTRKCWENRFMRRNKFLWYFHGSFTSEGETIQGFNLGGGGLFYKSKLKPGGEWVKGT
jgi:hypothetical protein